MRTNPLRQPTGHYSVKRVKIYVDRKKPDKRENIEKVVRFQLEKQYGTYEQDVDKVRAQCFLILNINKGYMEDVEISDTVRDEFHVFFREPPKNAETGKRSPPATGSLTRARAWAAVIVGCEISRSRYPI